MEFLQRASSDLLGAFIFLFLGTLSTGCGIYFLVRMFRIRINWIRTNGVVIGNEVIVDAESKSKKYKYSQTVRFQVDEEIIETKVTTLTQKKIRVGERIYLYYHPENWNQIHVEDKLSEFRIIGLLSFGGLIFIWVGVKLLLAELG